MPKKRIKALKIKGKATLEVFREEALRAYPDKRERPEILCVSVENDEEENEAARLLRPEWFAWQTF